MTESQTPLVDINRGTLAELVTIRGIGPGLAEKIIQQRPYTTLTDLVRVPGINALKLETLKPFMTIVEKKAKPAPKKVSVAPTTDGATHVTTVGETETFIFLEDRNDRQDALLIIFGGFILGLLLLILRRAHR